MLAEAHQILAGLYQDEHKWSEAVELWKAVLDEKRLPPEDPGIAYYNLGVCCRQLDQLPRAAEAWAECLRRARGDERKPRRWRLADLSLHEVNSEKAVAMLAEAVAKVRKEEDWKIR